MVASGAHAESPSRLAVARSRGALTGPLLVLLGAWGGIIPFVGHYFGYGFTPNNTWAWTAGRFWLEVLPAIATFVGGLLITGSGNRVTGMLGGWLAALAGAWFVLGTTFTPLWNAGYIGVPSGGTTQAVWERIGMFSGLGVVIVLLAAAAVGRFSVVGVRDVRVLGAGTAGGSAVRQPYPGEAGTAGPDTVSAERIERS